MFQDHAAAGVADFDCSICSTPRIFLDGRTCDRAERGLEVAAPQEAQEHGEEDREDRCFPKHHCGGGLMDLTL